MSNEKLWVVIPAAGYGTRLGGEVPKQYLTLGSQPILQHVLDLFLSCEQVQGVYLVLASDDAYWPVLRQETLTAVTQVTGGNTRMQSVYNGLCALADKAKLNDWILVHDAARPIVTQEELNRFLDALWQDPVGGLFALPVHDTLKQVQAGVAEATVDRSQYWLAQTPQMFRFQMLKEAFEKAEMLGEVVSDEAQAIEKRGLKPRIVPGGSVNMKITSQADLDLARAIYAYRSWV